MPRDRMGKPQRNNHITRTHQDLSKEQGTSSKWGNSRRLLTADSCWLEQRSTSNPVGTGNQMCSHGCAFRNVEGEACPASNCVHTTQQHMTIRHSSMPDAGKGPMELPRCRLGGIL